MDVIIPSDKAVFPGRTEDQEWNNNQKEDDYCAGWDDFMGFHGIWKYFEFEKLNICLHPDYFGTTHNAQLSTFNDASNIPTFAMSRSDLKLS